MNLRLHRCLRAARWLAVALAVAGVTAAGRSLWSRQERTRLLSQEYEPPPPGMVFVPAGEFWMGSNDPRAEPDEKPLRRVFVRAFYMDRLEVTNRRYQEFKPDHAYPEGADDLPATSVFKHEAEAFCRATGRRLPTSAEWEKAARGTDGRIYPWGNEFLPGRANIAGGPGESTKLPGASFPGGASPYGCHDLCGNAWEWVSDVRVDWIPFARKKDALPRGIIRGGAHGYGALLGRTSYQGFEGLGATCNDVGFRCAMDAVPKMK